VVFAVFSVLLDAPAFVGLTVSTATLVVLAWSPIRLRGQGVVLHDKGLLLSGAGHHAAVAFEDIHEVWFEIPRLHSTQGGYLRSVRLVELGGRSHRVPLMVDGGLALARAILRECSTPLAIDARKAVADGEVLTFGSVRLDRTGITIRGAYAPWAEIRLVRIQPAQVVFFRRARLVPWRSVRLTRIPNPGVLCALVAQNVKDVQRDRHLIVDGA
jgi:hypothetical protein